jgi:hypothetical protein
VKARGSLLVDTTAIGTHFGTSLSYASFLEQGALPTEKTAAPVKFDVYANVNIL